MDKRINKLKHTYQTYNLGLNDILLTEEGGEGLGGGGGGGGGGGSEGCSSVITLT